MLVVGAGPAGLECATVLAKRGFERVRLVDAAAEIGGCMRWIPRLPGLADWGRFVDWRRRESERLANLEIVTGVMIPPPMIVRPIPCRTGSNPAEMQPSSTSAGHRPRPRSNTLEISHSRNGKVNRTYWSSTSIAPAV